MAQRNTLLLVLILAVLLLGTAYAALENITLNINGTVQATPDQSNFKVTFVGSPSSSGDGSATLQLTSDTTATMNVYGLSVLGDKLTATFSIKNASSDLSAQLSSTVTNNNTTYFKVTPVLTTTDLEHGETTTLKVSVELIKTPITTQTDSIQINIVASPYQS